MTRKPTDAEMRASDRAYLAQMELEAEMREARRRGLLVPAGWEDIARSPAQGREKKARVTIRLDQDLVDWFKNMGPGYQVRMNRVLRLFKDNVVSGELSGKWERSWLEGLRKPE